MYTKLHTKIFTLKHGKFEKILTLEGQWLLTSIILLWNNWKLKNFGKIQTFLGLKRQKIVRMHKTCLTSHFLRLSLARFSREMAYLPSRKNLANDSLRNCDVRQVLCILTIFCRFKLKNVCILPKFSSFQSFQSKITLVECCEEVIVPPE